MQKAENGLSLFSKYGRREWIYRLYLSGIETAHSICKYISNSRPKSTEADCLVTLWQEHFSPTHDRILSIERTKQTST
jgi:hypothetical protein